MHGGLARSCSGQPGDAIGWAACRARLGSTQRPEWAWGLGYARCFDRRHRRNCGAGQSIEVLAPYGRCDESQALSGSVRTSCTQPCSPPEMLERFALPCGQVAGQRQPGERMPLPTARRELAPRRYLLAVVSPPRSFLNCSKSTCMPLKIVLQCRVMAAIATASLISASVAPACRAETVSDQMQ